MSANKTIVEQSMQDRMLNGTTVTTKSIIGALIAVNIILLLCGVAMFFVVKTDIARIDSEVQHNKELYNIAYQKR